MLELFCSPSRPPRRQDLIATNTETQARWFNIEDGRGQTASINRREVLCADFSPWHHALVTSGMDGHVTCSLLTKPGQVRGFVAVAAPCP